MTEQVNRLSSLLRRGEKKLEKMKEDVLLMERSVEKEDVLLMEKIERSVEKENESVVKESESVVKEKEEEKHPCCVEILKGEERVEALEGDPIAKEGMLTVILRSSEDDSKCEAVRLPRVSVSGCNEY